MTALLTVLITMAETCRRTAKSRSTVWRLSRCDPGFPQPRRDGGRTKFVEAEVESYLAALPLAREVPIAARGIAAVKKAGTGTKKKKTAARP